MSAIGAVVKNQQSDNDKLKARQKATWEDGDYARFAKFLEPGAIEVLDSWNIGADSKLLDVACGSGQTAIPAAKTGMDVTGIDIADNLIDHARKRAVDAGLSVRFDVGDAEQLPYGDKDFDVIISMFGAMFAPNPEIVVDEFARVLKPGGRVYMANWTPTSMPAQMFKLVAGVVAPPPGFISPVLWGDEDTVTERLAEDFTDIQLTRKTYPQWQYPFGPSELVDLFRSYFGPVKRAFEVLDPEQQLAFHDKLEAIYTANSEVTNDIMTIIGGEYLEVIAIRR